MRSSLLARLGDSIASLPDDRVMRLAIDGVDGAGKTFLADELAEVVVARGRPVIRASVDGFHNPRAIRYRQGRASPKGYYQDAYDYGSLRKCLLDPLGPGGSRRYVLAVFDHVVDRPVECEEQIAPADAILILDGVFLHRLELRDVWDFSIFLDVPFEISVPRGADRGPGWGGSPDPNRRYVNAQKHYLHDCTPQQQATVLIDNSDLSSPLMIRGP